MCNHRKIASVLLALVVGCLCTASAAAAVPGVETWDNAALLTNGWMQNTTSSTVIHAAAGGNPGGFIVARRAGAFDIGALIDSADSAAFTGNYAGIGGVSVDLRFESGDFTDAWLRFRTGATVNGWRLPLTAAFPANVWGTYSTAINPAWTDGQAAAAGWIQEDPTSGSFASVLADVDTAEVRIAGTSDSLLVNIDNFNLTAVPEPTSAVLLAAGLLAVGAARFVRRRQ